MPNLASKAGFGVEMVGVTVKKLDPYLHTTAAAGAGLSQCSPLSADLRIGCKKSRSTGDVLSCHDLRYDRQGNALDSERMRQCCTAYQSG